MDMDKYGSERRKSKFHERYIKVTEMICSPQMTRWARGLARIWRQPPITFQETAVGRGFNSLRARVSSVS